MEKGRLGWEEKGGMHAYKQRMVDLELPEREHYICTESIHYAPLDLGFHHPVSSGRHGLRVELGWWKC